jgi:hypothetical protein
MRSNDKPARPVKRVNASGLTSRFSGAYAGRVVERKEEFMKVQRDITLRLDCALR